MNKCYIISRFRGDTIEEVDFNIRVAQHFCRETLFENKIPIAPQIYYTQFLDDDDADERKLGMLLGKSALNECDEFLLVVVDGKISSGMRAEIEEAGRLKVPGKIVCLSSSELKARLANEHCAAKH